MSNTIAHLAVARKILLEWQRCNNKYMNSNAISNQSSNMTDIIMLIQSNSAAYYLGAVAPDTIGSKPDCAREDKRRVHLREDIRDSEWLLDEKMAIFDNRVADFVNAHIRTLENTVESQNAGEQIAFNIGYLVHLLTDKWNHKTIRQALLKVAKENSVQESDREFFHMCVNDLEALDNYLLNQYPEINDLFFKLVEIPAKCGLEGYIEQEYIAKSMNWWKNDYLVSVKTRDLKYITEADIETFIDVAANEIVRELKAYEVITGQSNES